MDFKKNNYRTSFLEDLFEHNIRTIHTKIELLSWDERTLNEIQGIVKEGSYGSDGSSNVRRNLNLTFSTRDREDQLVFKFLTPDKKIRLYIGLENTTLEYVEDKIIWFEMGIFILTEPAYSHAVDSSTITITANDKMTMLNGVLGGKLTTPVSFIQKQGDRQVSMSWREIFLQSAVLFGNEDPSRVVIDSVPDYIKEYTQVKSVGGLKDKFIHVRAPKEIDGERIIVKSWDPRIPETEMSFNKGDRVYKLRRFGPADPRMSSTDMEESYIKNVGEPITSIFDDIKEALSGTHEYFYTRSGDLMFQPIKNFLNQSFNPEINPDLGYFGYELKMDDFIPNYLGLPFVYNFADKKTIASYTNNPTFTNIKNDFVVTGKNGQILEVAIDDRPTIKNIEDWFTLVARDFNSSSKELEFIQKDGVKREVYNPITNTVPFELKEETKGKRAVYVDVPLDKVPWQIGLGLKNYFIRNLYGSASTRILPRWGIECESMIFKWVASIDKETLIPNTGIFNPGLINIGTPWLSGYPIAKAASTENDVEELDKLNPVFSNTGDSSFWSYYLDLIDTDTVLGKYSISLIGKRSETLNVASATTMFRTDPKELVIITEEELASLGGETIIAELRKQGQAYAVIQNISDQMFNPPIVNQNKNVYPYSNIVGDSSKHEQLYFNVMGVNGANGVHALVGGKFGGTIKENIDVQEKEHNGNLVISRGDYKHPITKKIYSNPNTSQILTPFGDDDLTETAFLAFIEGKNARCPNSGSHNHFAIVKNIGPKWYYSRVNGNIATWVEFQFRESTDVLVSTVLQNVYKGADMSFGTGRIDSLSDLFNIRDSKLTDLFSVDGAVDCFSSIRNLIYQHTNTSDVVSIQVLPVYNLEPNTLIYLEDELTDISGMYMIISTSIQMSPRDSPTMNITAVKANPRI